jgi:hypothetical protein
MKLTARFHNCMDNLYVDSFSSVSRTQRFFLFLQNWLEVLRCIFAGRS